MADSLSKISSVLDTARELTLEAASSASARLMDETPLRPKDISALLNGRSDREKLSGMKQVITLMAKGEDCSLFFADVIKNIASNNIETRKLVYTYLLRYADHEPDLSLLSINTIQKSLGDQSPLIRALAVRVMSGIRVPVIAPILTLAIKQCTNDLSPIVKKAAAQAIAKCYMLDPSSGPQLLELLESLLADGSTMVVGAALMSLSRTFPDRLDLIHGIYRNICRNLHDFDEWSQVTIIDMLVRYTRMFIQKPRRFKCGGGNGFLDNNKGEEIELDQGSSSDILDVDPDLQLLYDCASSLLFSRNGSVVLAVAKLYFYLGPDIIFTKYQVAGPVVRLLRSDAAVQQIALTNIRSMALARGEAFVPFLNNFFAFPTEPVVVSTLKIEILTLLYTDSSSRAILSELKYYALNSDSDAVTSQAMRAMGRCAVEVPAHSAKILKWLLKQVKASKDASVVSEALSTIRVLVQQDIENQTPTVVRLAKSLDNNSVVPTARASILWLVGELSSSAHEVAVEALRANTKTFAYQDQAVRCQLVLLAAKVYSTHLDRQKDDSINDMSEASVIVPKLFNHVMHLARYDPCFDTRDRARMFASMLTSSISTDVATLVLQAPKPSPVISLRGRLTSASGTTAPGNLVLGTSSLAVEHPLDGYQTVPSWTADPVDASVRDEPVVSDAYAAPHAAVSSMSGGGGSTAAKSLSHKDFAAGDYKNVHGVVNGRKLTEQSLEDFLGSGSNAKGDDGDDDDDEEEESDSDEYETGSDSDEYESDSSDSK